MKNLIALFLILVVAVACVPQSTVTTKSTYTPTSSFNPDNVQPTHFKSDEEFKSFVSSHGSTSSGGIAMERGALAAPMAADAKASGGATSFSETNNQVAGVDEADSIKTDGKYIYTITGNTFFIVSAGDNATIISQIELNQTPQGIFVEGDHLAVFGNFYDIDYFKEIGFVPRNGGMTYFNVYDISDRANPALEKEYKFEGAYFQSRMKDGNVYFAVTSSPGVRAVNPTPIIVDGTTVRAMPVDDIYYFPVPYDNPQLITVHSVNLDNLNDAISSKAITVEWGNTLYMSDKNIYITSTENINEWQIRQDIIMSELESQLTSEDRSLIDRIKSTDDDILTKGEKDQKIYAVYASYYDYMNSSDRTEFDEKVDSELKDRLDKYDAMTYTIINRISIENGLSVAATGKVPGTLSSQFAMDEYNGHLRVATTIQPRWNWWPRPLPMETAKTEVAVAQTDDAPVAEAPNSKMAPIRQPEEQKSSNNVYVLDMDMNVVGKLTGLAEGEQIYSTRFMGDRLYMVTFRQVDPFFAIDLSDPANPVSLGELKLPGFSRYLHPYDDHTIIGIGHDATDMGRQQGLKISLFDVTNVSKPREIAKWVANDDYSQSIAEYEHHAFLFDREKELLVIPAYSYNWEKNSQKYNGAMVFRVTPNSIKMRGIIDHSTANTQYWSPSVERSLWIDDLLYTKSPNLLRVNDIETLRSVANVTLTSSSTGPYPVY